MIRGADPGLSVLSDRVLVALWGVFSCEKFNRFWTPCEPATVSDFLIWSAGQKKITHLVKAARLEAETQREARAFTRSVRSRPRFIAAWDGRILNDPRLREGSVRPAAARRQSQNGWASVEELIKSVNSWCREKGIMPTVRGSTLLVDERFVRYCCRYHLMDRPGSPSGERRRGFSEKHFSQLRLIRLLQARSLATADINVILYGRTLAELYDLERDELSMFEDRADESVPGARQNDVVQAGS